MATADNDIRKRIANTLGDEVLRDAIDARDRYDAAVAQLREAAGATIDDDDDQWRKLTGDSSRDLSPMTHQRMQKLALYLWESNLLANRIIELPLAYLLAEGVSVSADDGLVQEVIDRFWGDPINAMDLKLPKKLRELSLYGEQCWPVFVNEYTGHVRLGYLDPEEIETLVVDPDNGEQAIGIVTRKKKGIARRYRVIVNGQEDELFTNSTQEIRRSFSDGEAFFFRVNDLSNGRRGRSDLLGQIDWLDAYDQFMFGEIDRASASRAFIWDVKLTGANQEQVDTYARKIHPPKPNSVRVRNESEEWTTVSPDLKAYQSSEHAKLFRNHMLGGATLPSHFYGDGGDANRATAAEMGDPTFKMFAMRQTYAGYILMTVCQYVIRQWELAHNGREPDLHDPAYAISVNWPEMVSRDISKYAAALQQVTAAAAQAVDNELMSRERAVQIIGTIASRLGVEYDASTELEAAMEDGSVQREKDAFQDLPDGGVQETDDATA